jgi:transcriptional regulator with XRE-family HTH domain
MDLGNEVRSRRVRLGLTLDGLAERSGVSRAMLSEIERGAKNPTIRVVAQIAEGLGCTVSALLGEPAPPAGEAEVVRAAERRTLVDPRSGVARHALSPATQRRGLEVLWYDLPAGADTGDFPPHRPGVEEQLTVVRGALDCRIGDRRLSLETGDSLWFRADVAHGFRNRGEEPCAYVLLIDSTRAGQDR